MPTNVVVKSIDNNGSTTVPYDETTTLRKLRADTASKLGINSDELQLVFNGELIMIQNNLDKLLSEFGVKHGSNFFRVMRVNGGQSYNSSL